MPEALIALGGNVGDVRDTIDRAIGCFCDGETVQLVARSSDYLTPPWGVTDQPPFVNCAHCGRRPRWRRRRCSSRAQAVEALRPRPRQGATGVRAPIDIDLIAYDDVDAGRRRS